MPQFREVEAGFIPLSYQLCRNVLFCWVIFHACYAVTSTLACFSVFAGAEKPIRLIAQVRRDLREIFRLANLLNNWKKLSLKSGQRAMEETKKIAEPNQTE